MEVSSRYAPEKIPGLIESNDAELRNQAGETIAVLYEIAREINSVCQTDFDDDLRRRICSFLS